MIRAGRAGEVSESRPLFPAVWHDVNSNNSANAIILFIKHMVTAAEVIVVAESADRAHVERAEALGRRLGLGLRNSTAVAPGELALAYHNDVLELREASTRPGRGLSIDFTSIAFSGGKRRGGLSRKQPLARAVGKEAQTVLDCTAGLGHDAALLACMGYEVTAVERSPIIAALVQDGLRRAFEDAQLRRFFENRMTVLNADARDVVRERGGEFDSIYIDPMFPPKRKTSALAKKSIRLVRQLVGDDEDASVLLAEARRSGAKRIAVKRPHHAPPLAPDSVAVIESKLLRYDIYR